MSQKKNYVGKGTQVKDFEMIELFLKVDELEKFIFEKEGQGFVKMVVSRLQQPDNFGRTHTAYVPVKEPEMTVK